MNLRKNFKFFFLMTFLTLTFSLTACSNSFTPAVMTTTKGENQKESAQEPIAETHTENNPGLPSDDPQPEQNLAEQDSPPTAKDTAWTSYTGIKAHIKETHGERFLISSDTDDFPGTFWVLGINDLAEPEELKDGTSIFILMEDLKEKEKDGINIYRARQFFALPEEENKIVENLLLTNVPTFTLTDVLSSKYQPLEIQSGNYTWSLEENGENSEVIACGSDPLEEAAMEHCARLKLPEYNGMNDAGYLFSTKIQPDKLVIRQWPKDAAGIEAAQERVTTYYYVVPFLNIEPDKIYEFDAQWKKENQSQRKFSGNANYVLVTE